MLKQQDRIKLMEYQWDNFGQKLDIPQAEVKPIEIPTEEIDETEIQKFMAEAPKHQRRVE